MQEQNRSNLDRQLQSNRLIQGAENLISFSALHPQYRNFIRGQHSLRPQLGSDLYNKLLQLERRYQQLSNAHESLKLDYKYLIAYHLEKVEGIKKECQRIIYVQTQEYELTICMLQELLASKKLQVQALQGKLQEVVKQNMQLDYKLNITVEPKDQSLRKSRNPDTQASQIKSLKMVKKKSAQSPQLNKPDIIRNFLKKIDQQLQRDLLKIEKEQNLSYGLARHDLSKREIEKQKNEVYEAMRIFEEIVEKIKQTEYELQSAQKSLKDKQNSYKKTIEDLRQDIKIKSVIRRLELETIQSYQRSSKQRNSNQGTQLSAAYSNGSRENNRGSLVNID